VPSHGQAPRRRRQPPLFRRVRKGARIALPRHGRGRSGQARGPDPVPQRQGEAHRHGAYAPEVRRRLFVCPKCARLAITLYLVDDAPLCIRCCEALNIRHASEYGFGRETRRRAQDKHLDQLVARLETKQPLRLKPAPSSWGGKAQLVYNGRKLTDRMRRNMISLRLNQLANQQASSRAGDHDVLTTYRPKPETLQTIDITPIWRANTTETLQQALDAAQCSILAALESDDPQQRLNAAKLLLNTKQARDRGL
jgi:hypothetical protein